MNCLQQLPRWCRAAAPLNWLQPSNVSGVDRQTRLWESSKMKVWTRYKASYPRHKCGGYKPSQSDSLARLSSHTLRPNSYDGGWPWASGTTGRSWYSIMRCNNQDFVLWIRILRSKVAKAEYCGQYKARFIEFQTYRVVCCLDRRTVRFGQGKASSPTGLRAYI